MARKATPSSTAERPTRRVTRSGTKKPASKSGAAVADPPTARQAATEPTAEQIQARAYQIYLARGDRDGDAHSDWLRAEQELRSRVKRS